MQDKKLEYATIVFDRLIEVSKASNLEELADFLGIKYGTLRGQKSRGSIPYDEIVNKCSDDELVFVLKGHELVANHNGEGMLKEPQVPYYTDVKPAAGEGLIPTGEEDLIYIGLPRTFIYDELHSTPNELFIMRLRGDSMEPTIGERDFIIVQEHPIRPFHGVYLIRIGDGLLCKRVEEHPDGLRIISDNPYYKPYIVNPEHENMKVIGRVVWYGRSLL